ncbi:MAG: hypothetical protein GF364_03080 [Candidatus Lokiarchaeota archaeon]|nr:hypothetical protein [Candidatus Lokiarchaeota archaeon]
MANIKENDIGEGFDGIDEREVDKDNGISYISCNYLKLIAGLILISVLVISLLCGDQGLIFFIYSLPTTIWAGAIPGIIGIILIIHSLLQIELIHVEKMDGIVKLYSKALVKQEFKIIPSEIQYIMIKKHESNPWRWLAVLLLLFNITEAHIRNGLDLIGKTDAAILLLAGGILSIIALVFFLVSRLNFIEIGGNGETYQFYLPKEMNQMNNASAIFEMLGYTLPRNMNRNRISIENTKNIFQENPVEICLSILLLAIGTIQTFSTNFFIGEFMKSISITIGLKILCDLSNQLNYVQIESPNNGINKAELGLPQSKSIDGLVLVSERGRENEKYNTTNSIAKLGLLEWVLYFYICAQSIKYAFNFIWSSELAFFIDYTIIGIVLSVLVILFVVLPRSYITLHLTTHELVEPKNTRRTSKSKKLQIHYTLKVILIISIFTIIPVMIYCLGKVQYIP